MIEIIIDMPDTPVWMHKAMKYINFQLADMLHAQLLEELKCCLRAVRRRSPMKKYQRPWPWTLRA